MKFFDSLWGRMSPRSARVALMVVSLVAMVLGGAADQYWS